MKNSSVMYMSPADLCSTPTEIEEKKLQEKFEKLGRNIYKLNPPEWLNEGLNIQWNLNESEFFWSFNGEKNNSIQINYPDGFAVAKINTLELYNKIFETRQIKDMKTFRKYCDKRRAQGVLGRWLSGESVTPPFFCINVENDQELILSEGCHRFNIAYLVEVEEVYFIAPKSQKKRIEILLPSATWTN